MDRQTHWQTVYETKQPNEVSWTQAVPATSLDFINNLNLPKSASIIDVGGGDSTLVDFLLEQGYENITVLDISAKALERARARLGSKAEKVKWVVSDITEFVPQTSYDVWHDRAAFHFLTNKDEVEKYLKVINEHLTGYLVIGTFSDKGPAKCSGLEIKRYTEGELANAIGTHFEKLNCRTEEHITPFGTGQNFVFCSFAKK